MHESLYESTVYYLRWYMNYFLEWWGDIGPTEYGVLLISIGLFGWLLMKNAVRH